MKKAEYLKKKKGLIAHINEIFPKHPWMKPLIGPTCDYVRIFLGIDAREDYKKFLTPWHDPNTSIRDNTSINYISRFVLDHENYLRLLRCLCVLNFLEEIETTEKYKTWSR